MEPAAGFVPQDAAATIGGLRERAAAMGEAQQARSGMFDEFIRHQQRSLKLTEMGLRSQAKHQQVMNGIQSQIERLYGINLAIDRNADDLLKRQQKTGQNITGSP